MKKNIIFTIMGFILGITITAYATYVYTARDIGYTPTDTEWNVSNASDALSSLKTDLNNISIDVNNYKNEIIEALNNNGGELNNNSSMEDIVTSINEIKTIDPSSFNINNQDYVTVGNASSTYKVTTSSWNKVAPIGKYVFNAIVLCNFAEGNSVTNTVTATNATLSNINNVNMGQYVRLFTGEVEITSTSASFTFDVKGSSSGRTLTAAAFLKPIE